MLERLASGWEGANGWMQQCALENSLGGQVARAPHTETPASMKDPRHTFLPESSLQYTQPFPTFLHS